MTMIILALALACGDLKSFQMPGMTVTITRAEKIADDLPARCRVDGIIDPRTGADGKSYGIGFAVALPDNWNGRCLFQGGGGLNGNVANPVGAQAALDFYYEANGRVAPVAKEIVVRYYGRPADHSYFVGRSVPIRVTRHTPERAILKMPPASFAGIDDQIRF